MPLTPGTRIGPYAVESAIGAGGMGEVYKARDTKLDRHVAIKILPESFADDPERLARFEREAKTLAALNHPNIAIIHGFEQEPSRPGSGPVGMQALIMEFVEGPTLAERIAEGPTPIDEALAIARQVALALEAAHEQGIIHRDLKPANVKVRPDGTVKVLDFGLAKALAPDAVSSASVSLSPTITSPAGVTGAGVLLGTATYMSPEQAKGKPAERRSDVWAFGCVLFEMLTGRRAFEGDDVSDTLAAVLRAEPEWNRLPADTPVAIRRLLRRCLQKDRSRRLQSIGDARIEIDELDLEPVATSATGSSKSPRSLVYPLAAIAAASLFVAAAVTIRHAFEPAPDAPTVRFDIRVPDGLTIPRSFQLSPDGRKLAFVGATQSKSQIWMRSLDQSEAQPMPGTEGTGYGIFWAPDSQAIGFFADGRLKKVPLGGGPAQVLCTVPGAGGLTGGPDAAHYGSWGADDVILVSGSGAQTLSRVSAQGGQPAAATQLTGTERSHRYVNFLPDGRHYSYLTLGPEPVAYIGTLDSTERTALPGVTSEAKYDSSGHIVFIREGALMAQRFDVRRLLLSGAAFPIVDPFRPVGTTTGPFSLSMTGALAYRTGATTRTSQFAWFDRSGKQLELVGSMGEYAQPDLSPDARYVAFQRGSQPDIWVLDVQRGVTSPVTSDPGRDTSPVWAPDGKRIAFDSTRGGGRALYERTFGVVGEDRLLLKAEETRNMSDWSRDGRYLVYESGTDVWALPMPITGDAKPLRITETPFLETSPRISPDGRWIAFESNDSRGEREVFIQSFPQPGVKLQVSTRGGTQPNWSYDSRELFYFAPDFTVMAVSMKTGGKSGDPGAPRPLFRTRLAIGNRRDYWVARDGRFLLSLPADEQSATPIRVILNWATGLALE